MNLLGLQNAQTNIDKAINLQKNNPSWLKQKAIYLFSEGNFEKAIALSQQATELAPFKSSSYEFEAELLLQIIRGLKERDDSSYKEYYTQLLKIPEKTEKVMYNVPEELLKMWHGIRPDKNQRIMVIIQETKKIVEQ